MCGGYYYRENVMPIAMDTIARASGARVAHVQVTGAVLTPKEDIAETLGLKAGDSLVTFNTGHARKLLQELPWIKEVSVERRLPDTIRVEVYEHKPLARVQQDGTIWVANKAGDLLVEVTNGEFGDLPLLSGSSVAQEAASLFVLLQEKPNLMALLKEAERVGERRWNLHLKSGVTVMLPEKNPQQALAWLKMLDDKRHVLTLTAGTVDLRLEDRVTLNIPAEAEAGVVLGKPEQS